MGSCCSQGGRDQERAISTNLTTTPLGRSNTTSSQIEGVKVYLKSTDSKVESTLLPTYRDSNNDWAYRSTLLNVNNTWEKKTSGELIALKSGGQYLTVKLDGSGVQNRKPQFSSSTTASPPTSKAVVNGNAVNLTWFTKSDDTYSALSFTEQVGQSDPSTYYLVPSSNFIEIKKTDTPRYVFDIEENNDCKTKPFQTQVVNFTELSATFTSYQLSPNGKYDRKPSSLSRRGIKAAGHEAINVIGRYDSHINGSFVILFEEQFEFSVEFDTKHEKFAVTPECYEDIQCLYDGKKIKDILYCSITFCEIIQNLRDKKILVKVGEGKIEETYYSAEHGNSWRYRSTPPDNDILTKFTISLTEKCGASIQNGKLYLTVKVYKDGPEKPVFQSIEPSGTPVAEPKDEPVTLTRFWKNEKDNYNAFWFTVKKGDEETQHYLTPKDGAIGANTDVKEKHVFQIK